MPRNSRTSKKNANSFSPQRHRRLFFEPLEERRLLAIDAALIKDIASGSDSNPSGFVQYGSNVYFSADDGTTGFELWRSDGTTATLFANLHPTASSNPKALTVASDKLFFIATTPATGNEVWVTDGVSAPQVFDVFPGGSGSQPDSLISFNGEVYFVATNGTGKGLWHTNGVAPASLVAGTAGLNPVELLVSGSKLYFTATPTAPPSLSRLYTYDGASVQGLNITSGSGSYGPQSLVDFGGTVYFSGFRGSPATGQELFKVTGPTSVDLAKDINPGPNSSDPARFTVAGSNLLFQAYNGSALNLWRTFSGGTQKVSDPIGVTVPIITSFASVGSLAHFVGISASGKGIFTSDGTTITSLPLTFGMNPDQLTNVAGTLYFAGTKAGVNGRELWYLNGSTPTLVKEIAAGSASSSPDLLTAVGSSLYFLADDGSTGIEPWIAKDFQSPASQTLSQDSSGNLVITDIVNGIDDITIQTNGSGGWTITGIGANFGILGTVPAGITASGNTISIPASASPSFGEFIFNTAGGSDKLTVKLDSLGKRVDYDGGESASDDDHLVVQSLATYTSQTTTLTSIGGGDLDFGSDGSIEIHFANLKPVDTTGVVVANKIINLPASSTATLKDYLAAADGFMQLTFNGTGPEDERFQNPSTSLTINATGGGTNLIQFETADSGFAPTMLHFSGTTAASDTFRLATGFPGVLPNASNVVMTIATLDLNNQNETIGSLAGNGAVSLGSGTLTTGNPTSTSYSGLISGSGGLVKQGVGTFTLAGANTYAGATTVNAGTLGLQNGEAISDTAGAVSVANGATLELLNNETISSYVGSGDGVGSNDSLLILGNNRLTSTGNATLGNVTTLTSGSLVSVNGSMIDGDDDLNISGTGICLVAAQGIGHSGGTGTVIETAVSFLEAKNSDGFAAANGTTIQIANSVGGLLTITDVSSSAGLGGADNAEGATAILNGSPLVVASDSISVGAVTLSAGESVADDVDNLSINSTITVQSTGSSVTLNSGDDISISSTSSILAATTVTIQIDSGDLDATGETLSIATGAVITAPEGATFNGGAQADIFNFAPQPVGTAIVVNGSAPITIPGDVLNLDLAGATGTIVSIDGINDGTFMFTNRASVEYNSVEDVNAPVSCYDVVFNMTAFGASDFTVRRNGLGPLGTKLEIVNNGGPTVVFSADLADIASLKINGTAGADTLTLDDVNGMVSFDPACIPSTVFPDNPNSAGVARFYFDGAGGANALNFQLTESGAAQVYAIGSGAAPGAGEGEVLTTNAAGRNLVVYFSNLGPAGSVNRTGAGAAAGSLTVLGDVNSNTLTITAAAGLTTVNPVTYTPFTFAPGGNYSQFNLQAAGGSDTYNINGAGAAGLNNLLIPAVVTDSAGTDSLFVNDSSDTTGDVATITHSGINGLNPVAGDEISFSGIETLDVTGTSAGDTLTTSLGGAVASPTSYNDLVTVNVRGAGGTDSLFLHVADSLTNASLDFVNLFGDAGGDNFGGPAAADHIRPVLRTGQMQIVINGDANAKTTGPVNPGTDPVLTGPDRLFLDLTTTDSGAMVIPVVIVDTNGGYADSANTQSFRYNGVEDIDLYDGGVLTNSAIGDFYLRATDQTDYVQFVSAAQVNPVFRIRVGNLYYPTSGGNYGPYTTAGQTPSKVYVYGRGGADTITMYNTRLNAAFFGEAGDDIITGGYGDDLLVGGAGNDRLNGAAVGGNDEIWGDDYNPAIDNPAVASQTGTGNDQINTYGGTDTAYGQGGNDIINTGAGNDYINGGPGDDQLDGQAGNDRIYGGDGVDTASGSEGNDIVAGNGGNDLLYGRTGNDILIGGLGQDIVNGNEGSDALVGDESNGAGSNSLAKGDAADAALLALMTLWGPAPTLTNLGGFNSTGDDSSVDTLWGGTEADAFFITASDNPADRNAVGYGPDLN